MLKRIGFALSALLCAPTLVIAAEDARLLRFPDIHGDQIAFSHGGDLWTVSSTGGQARRLTTHDGLELFPRYSPDGKQIAFMGEYDGDQNVFVVDAAGGAPKRLTYHPGVRSTSERMGPESIVMEWTNDGKRILYRSREETHSVWEGKLYTVSPDGGFPVELPLPRGGFASFSKDGTKIAYCPIFRDFRTWKRYMGGTAQDVWIYDLANAKSEKLTDWEGTDNVPMWDHASGKIYFNSDRTGTLNLFVYDPADKSTKQVTTFTDYDVRWPSIGPGAIVFENGGWLYVLELPNGTPRKLSVQLGSDRLPARDRWVNVKDRIQDYSLSHDGKRALFGARGDIFTVPAKHGNTRNVTNTPNANDKYATFSPNNEWIAYVSDVSGEDDLYLQKVNSSDAPTRLTNDGDRYKYQILWSPDSKRMAWSDKSARVFWIDVATKSKTMITQGKKGDIRDYTWSPDSKFIAYSDNNKHSISEVWIYSLDENRTRVVTPGAFDDFNPVWDPQGKHLYFFSNRNYNPLLGNYEFNFVLDKMTEIHALVLSSKDASPFAPKSDEITPTKDEPATAAKKDDKKDDAAGEKKKVTVSIDWQGIMDRTVKFPIEAGQYNGLAASEGRVYYVSSGLGGLDGPVEEAKPTLHVFVMEDQKTHKFLEEFDGYDLTPDGKKMIIKKGPNYEIIDASGEKSKTGDNVLDLSNLDMKINLRAEWKQIFEEGWRLQRDFFYDSTMHGVDWKKMHDRYAPLLDHVDHRFDLTYVMGELIGELATGHTYVGGGEFYRPEANNVGLLGVNFVVDSSSRRYKIGRILQGENWRDDRRSPLTEPGVKASEGDYIIAINGKPLYIDTHPYNLTENTSGQTVSLTLAKSADGAGSWVTEPKTIGNESGLRYNDWVARKAHYTDSVSNGRIGYVHIPDMGGEGLKQFASTFYPQIRKEGLVVDVRWNGGGFVSQLIIERLRRVLSGLGKSRNFEETTYPSTVFHGYMACLCNEHSASDGDNFPHHFREYGLGPVIGKRTWGGVVGIRGHRPLVDGGFMNTPEFAKYDFDRKWIIENRGVSPDIEVEYPPEIVYKGGDPQIDRAVQEIMKQITAAPKVIPPPPSVPPDRR